MVKCSSPLSVLTVILPASDFVTLPIHVPALLSGGFGLLITGGFTGSGGGGRRAAGSQGQQAADDHQRKQFLHG